MRVRSGLLVVVGASVLAACNLLSGASDLQIEPLVSRVDAGAPRDASVLDHASPPPIDGDQPDAADSGDAGCTSGSATTLLGGAVPLMSYFELTPERNNLAGGIASATEVSLDNFDVSFAYSITLTATSDPGAGLELFAITSPAKGLSCEPGPSLCTLGVDPGFAVILRTSRGTASDPAPPYVTVVDSQKFPGQQPTNPTGITTAQAWTIVQTQGSGVPPLTTFHTMAITVRSGKVTATIDGASILTNMSIPNWVPGRVGTWGIGASTGQGAGFAERTVVGQVTFRQCP